MSQTLVLAMRAVRVLQTPLTDRVCQRCIATTRPRLSTETTSPNPDEVDNYDPSLPFEERGYRLKKTDYWLKKALPHRIPPQYLEHSTSPLLPPKEAAQRETVKAHPQIAGVVVSAGKMDKTVKVRIPGQRWDKKIKKHFADHTNHLVHDPNNSLVAGDLVSLHRLRVSTAVRHVVASIMAPFGTPVEARPPIPTPDELLAAYKERRFAKIYRKALRRKAAEEGTEAPPGVASVGNAGVTGGKGQPLPPGVLPGGRHEVGKINERAQHNKAKAMEFEAKAVDNLAEADVKAQELEERGVGADPKTSATIERGRPD